MDWIEAVKSVPPIEKQDLLRFRLSGEDQTAVMQQFNKALRNAGTDSADIASIALRKLLTRFPEWGEAALLYGLCLAIDGKYVRAAAGFQHALEIGLRSEQLTYLAQVCSRDVNVELSKKPQKPEENNTAKNFISSVIPKSNPLVQEEHQIRPRPHMQAPILVKASRRPARTKLATDRERRELLMQSTSSNGELPDDEIDVSIPKTPAEKLRISAFVIGALLVLAGLYFLITMLILPAVDRAKERSRANERLEYLTQALQEKSADPEVAEIIARYESEYGWPNTTTDDNET